MIKRLFGLTVFSTILFGLNQTANANEIIQLTGDVKLKRTGETKFQTANFLDSLNYEDEFQVGANSWLVIRCRNTDKPKIEQPGKYKVSNYCPQGEATEILDNNNTFRPPTEDLSQTPYIISPRNSSVFPESITIKWNRVSEATNYTVKIGNWHIETTDTKVIYTGNFLNPGFYFISVEADNGKFSSNVGFTVIDQKQAQFIREAAEKIKQEGLSTEVEAFILASFYRSNDLKMSAIEILEDLLQSGSQTKNVYLLLADIYKQVGLETEAYDLAQKALELGSN
ncbi:MAG: tetratricopeptide repeat protein [Xenococcus sp. (in: cyanobacteria)]